MGRPTKLTSDSKYTFLEESIISNIWELLKGSDPKLKKRDLFEKGDKNRIEWALKQVEKTFKGDDNAIFVIDKLRERL